MLRTSFGRIRPGHPTTSYPGVAQLVARLLWEDRRSIHSPKSESPEVLGTVACGGNPPPEDPPAKPALTTALPTDTKNLLFPSPHSIMQKIEYPGLAQLVARVVWEREARVRGKVLGNLGKPWDT